MRIGRLALKRVSYDMAEFTAAVKVADDLMLGPFKGWTGVHSAQNNFATNQVTVEDVRVELVIKYLREAGAKNIQVDGVAVDQGGEQPD